jgi:hypothetical protein
MLRPLAAGIILRPIPGPPPNADETTRAFVAFRHGRMTAFTTDAQALTEAASRHDRLAAWDAAGRLVSHFSNAATHVSPEVVFGLVWSGAATNGWFDIAELLAGAAAARADAPPGAARLHAQMLMERGFSEEALSRLTRILATKLLPYDEVEAYGHIGRIYKDRFVTAVDAGDEKTARVCLQRSVEAYQSGRRLHGAHWLGINAVALLARPEAAAFDPGALDQARELARSLQAQVAATPGDPYADAILAQTHLALGDDAAALPYVRRYVFRPAVSVFSLNNFHRQLASVWRLARRPSPGPEMLALASAALLERRDGALHLSSGDLQLARKVDLEAVFGADRFDTFENYRRGLDRCGSVARIGRSADSGIGSGFVLPGRLLSAKLDDRFVLITNAHVLSESDADRAAGALHPEEAVVTFGALEGMPPDRELRLGRLLCWSSPDEHDVAVAELSEPVAPKTPYPLAAVLPAAASQAPVRVIGHPAGRGLSLSVNYLLDHQVPRLHYRTATEGGSSGSPVFDHAWNLIGLHHAGGDAVQRLNGQPGTYQANEGIWIKAICETAHRLLP